MPEATDMSIEQTSATSPSAAARSAHGAHASRGKAGDAAPGGFMALLGAMDTAETDTTSLAAGTDTSSDLGGTTGFAEKGKKKSKGETTDTSELTGQDGTRIVSQMNSDKSLTDSLGITPHSFLADAVGFVAGAVVAAAGGGLIASAIASKIGTAVAKANGVGSDPAVGAVSTKSALTTTDSATATTAAASASTGTITVGMLPQGQNADVASGNIDKMRAMLADSKDAGKDTAKDAIDRMLASDGTLGKTDATKGLQARGQVVAAANHAASQAAAAAPLSASQNIAQASAASAADAIGGAAKTEASLLAQQVAAAAEGTRFPSEESLLASRRSERGSEKSYGSAQSVGDSYSAGWHTASGGSMATGVDGAAVGVAGSQGVFDNQLDDQLSYYMSQNGQSAEITLDTKEGGPVDVRVSISGNEAQVAFRSDQAHTRDAINSATAQLREMLQNQGVTLASVTVDSSANQQANADGSSGFGNRQSGEGRGTRHSLNMGATQPISTTRPVAGSATGGRLDLYV